MVELEELDELATRALAHPVAGPRPLAHLTHRVRQRRQRRVLAGGVITLLLLVAATGVGLRALGGDSDSSDVLAVGPDDRGLGSGRVVWPDGNPGWSQDELLDAVTTELLGWPAETTWQTEPAPGVSDDSTLTAFTQHPDVIDGRYFTIDIAHLDGSWRIVDGSSDGLRATAAEGNDITVLTGVWLFLSQEMFGLDEEALEELAQRGETESDAATIEVRWIDHARGEQQLVIDTDDFDERAGIDLPTARDDLGSVLVIARTADGQASSIWASAFDEQPSDATFALDELFGRPATPEDEFPYDEFVNQWDWEPSPPELSLDFDASRAVHLAEDVPAYVVPTEDREGEGVCFFITMAPPDRYPDSDSTQPVICSNDPHEFNASGLTQRVCGPDNRWYTAALVPQGLDPDDVAPYGTLHTSGAAILYDGTGPEEPVVLEYARGETVTLLGVPIGHQPGDRYEEDESSC